MEVTEEEFEWAYNSDQFVCDLSYVPDLRRQNIIMRKMLLGTGISEQLPDKVLNERLTLLKEETDVDSSK